MRNDDTLRRNSVKQLLMLHAALIEELRKRQVVRSSNNPVADYTEYLVTEKLGLARTKNSTAGHDAEDEKGVKYQIKGRRVTPHNNSRQLSAIRDLDTRPFDQLVGVIFQADFSIEYAGIVPYEVVKEQSTFVARTNSHRFIMRATLFNDPRVVEITSKLKG